MVDRDVSSLVEWERGRFIPGVTLDDAETVLVMRLLDEDRLAIEPIAGGIRVSATSWIGVVCLRDVEIRVVPKYAGGDLGVLRMLDYASGLPALGIYEDALRSLHAEGSSLVDLLGWLLADRTARIVRAGLLADYVHRDEELRVLRGRLRVMDQVRVHFGRIETLECAYDEHETDILENRILSGALGIAQRACRDPEVVSRVAMLRGVLDEACEGRAIDSELARGVLEYNRRNEHYRAAHEIAWLFLERAAIDDLFAAGRVSSFAFLIDMNRLFEDFVTRLLRDALEPAGTRVLAQRRDRSIIENELTGRPYGTIIPDILLDDQSSRAAAYPSARRREVQAVRPASPRSRRRLPGLLLCLRLPPPERRRPRHPGRAAHVSLDGGGHSNGSQSAPGRWDRNGSHPRPWRRYPSCPRGCRGPFDLVAARDPRDPLHSGPPHFCDGLSNSARRGIN